MDQKRDKAEVILMIRDLTQDEHDLVWQLHRENRAMIDVLNELRKLKPIEMPLPFATFGQLVRLADVLKIIDIDWAKVNG